MSHLVLTARLDVQESVRARWFLVYALIFGGIVAAFFAFGVTESRVLGFMGLSRLLVTYIQLVMAIMPIFILLTTVRSVAGDREAGVFEYLLSLPVGLGSWYWGRIFGRFLVVFLPVFLAMLGAAGWAVYREIEVPWKMFGVYTGLMAAMSWCFLGLGMWISTLARSTDVAQGAAFMMWLVFLLFLDLILLGVLIQGRVPANAVIAIALVNPLQVFRTGALMLFDPQLVVFGPAAYVIHDYFGGPNFIVYAMAYPTLVGTLAAGLGYLTFRRGDLV
ncbi:MAG: ABC transporter permease subunit [Deltaproteobacteria bacterium]|nr:ABC transporter permease subunit [Deltaproteobacteria bacterium]